MSHLYKNTSSSFLILGVVAYFSRNRSKVSIHRFLLSKDPFCIDDNDLVNIYLYLFGNSSLPFLYSLLIYLCISFASGDLFIRFSLLTCNAIHHLLGVNLFYYDSIAVVVTSREWRGDDG